ncbi:hypothetical protein [Gymnodinialimonas hymeniacidonis]|uniref:hypothetical protein n=1 Tax=Gymnodinialimonas hymeniacidonis TaxID=3126508 RepID=UPI0034C66664
MRPFRLLILSGAALSVSGCAVFSALFGDRADDYESPYLAAMADFSLCETAPDPSARQAAAARLVQAAAQMQAVTDPANAGHFYELDRVVAASERCQLTLAQ